MVGVRGDRGWSIDFLVNFLGMFQRSLLWISIADVHYLIVTEFKEETVY